MSDSYITLMQQWSSVAEDINQLALAALILPVFFLRKILAVPEDESLVTHINKCLYLSWFFLFGTIGMCLVYKSVVTCLMGMAMELGSGFACQADPVITFNLISISFFLGICFSFIGYFIAINSGKKGKS